MEGSGDGFNLPPPDWYNDPEDNFNGVGPRRLDGALPLADPTSSFQLEECYTNMDTDDSFYYSEELFNFAEPLPSLITLENVGQTNMETVDKSSETEEPAMETPAVETPVMETAPKKKDLPMRLYFGNGPRIHSKMCAEYGVVNKRCEDCGEVGKLTCFSSSFRKWALKRVTEEEYNQICSRCHLRGHTCVSCDLPISNRVDGLPVIPQATKAQHCGYCGEEGHNRRSCFRAV